MLLKIVALFLVAIAVLAMFGKLRVGGRRPPPAARLPRPRLCPDCGRLLVTTDACDCGGGGGGGGRRPAPVPVRSDDRGSGRGPRRG